MKDESFWSALKSCQRDPFTLVFETLAVAVGRSDPGSIRVTRQGEGKMDNLTFFFVSCGSACAVKVVNVTKNYMNCP